MLVLIFFLGAIFNRIRGGGLTVLIRPTVKLKAFLTKIKLWHYKDTLLGSLTGNKVLCDIVFALTIGLYCHFNFWGMLFLVIGHIAGSRKGWGDYMYAIEHRKVPEKPNEIYLIDRLILDGETDAVFRGTWALNIRGIVWSFCLGMSLIACDLAGNSVSIASSLVFFVGIPMGFIYSKTFDYCEAKPRNWMVKLKLTKSAHSRSNGWGLGEMIFGGYFWAVIAFLISIGVS